MDHVKGLDFEQFYALIHSIQKDGMAKWVERPNELSICLLFEAWSSETNDLKMYKCRYLAWHSVLLG